MRYDFTGKERDDQTTYDYFGARYYDSRIANWASIDPLFEKHFDYSPYNYVLRSPLVLIDPDGKQVNYQMKFDVGLESGGTKESEKIYELSNGELSAYQPGTLEPEAIDPVDILTGMAMAKIGFKMAEKFVFKEGTQIVSKTVAKETLTESTEKVVKFSSKKGEDLYKGFVDYLGEGAKGKLTRSNDIRFISKDKMRQIRFDINKFTPHSYPHIDIQKGFIQNGRIKWINIGKIKIE